MLFSVRVGYPDSDEYRWENILEQYKTAGNIELAFYSPEYFIRNVKADDVTEPLRDIPLNVTSVHMAHAQITDYPLFELVLDRTIGIAKKLNCKFVVVHPSKAELKQVENFINTVVDKILYKEKIFLCWETFESKKRVFSGADGIARFCHGKHWHKMCYDFSHVHESQDEVIKQIGKYLEYIKIFHVSNRIAAENVQHLPMFYKGKGELDLDYMPILKCLKEMKYDGVLVLEYLSEFEEEMMRDIAFLKNKIG